MDGGLEGVGMQECLPGSLEIGASDRSGGAQQKFLTVVQVVPAMMELQLIDLGAHVGQTKPAQLRQQGSTKRKADTAWAST